MSAFAVVLGIFTFLIVLYVGYELRREQRRTRMLSAFIAGLIARELDNGVDYDQLLFYISHEFGEDYWAEPARTFLKRERNLFHRENMGNGGFNMLFWDFFDREKNILDIAALPDVKHRVELLRKLSEFLKGREVQMLTFLRQDRDKELWWWRTGSDEFHDEMEMYKEMKTDRAKEGGKRSERK